jgi:hypothetical protein
MSDALITGSRHYVPNADRPSERLRFVAEPGTGKLVLQTTRDGGKNWKTISSEPSSNASAGWIQAINNEGSVSWVSPQSVFSNFFNSGTETVSWIDFNFPAELQANVDFGGFEVPDGLSLRVLGLQISFFSPPERSDIQLRFVNSSSGEEILGPINLSLGISFASQKFEDQVLLGPGMKIRGRISFGAESESNPGNFLVARLIVNKV